MVPFTAALAKLKSFRTSRSLMSMAFSLPPARIEMTLGEGLSVSRGSRS